MTKEREGNSKRCINKKGEKNGRMKNKETQ